MAVYKNTSELIGNTPLFRANKIEKSLNLQAKLYLKLENFNPSGSVKDRIAYSIIKDAEEKGELKEGGTIIEASSGNTGIGLAMIGTALGYKVIITMPESMSIERRAKLKILNAELVLTPAALGMKGAIAEAIKIKEQTTNAIIANQFENLANPKIHFETTGPEIWEDTQGNIDLFIAGVGTGGTITGAGQFLKSKNPNLKVIAIEPKNSAVLSGNPSGPHKIQGIGAGFIPKILNTEIYDTISQVENDEAFEYSRLLAKTEGLFLGISSGAALKVAIDEAKKEENKGKTIAAILPDNGDRYLSTELILN